MFELILKNGQRISSLKADDISTFWDKETANREAAERKAKRIFVKKEKKA